ncbi:hypothetical protein JCM3770_004035, partial [Rhodotorula araucariae]
MVMLAQASHSRLTPALSPNAAESIHRNITAPANQDWMYHAAVPPPGKVVLLVVHGREQEREWRLTAKKTWVYDLAVKQYISLVIPVVHLSAFLRNNPAMRGGAALADAVHACLATLDLVEHKSKSDSAALGSPSDILVPVPPDSIFAGYSEQMVASRVLSLMPIAFGHASEHDRKDAQGRSEHAMYMGSLANAAKDADGKCTNARKGALAGSAVKGPDGKSVAAVVRGTARFASMTPAEQSALGSLAAAASVSARGASPQAHPARLRPCNFRTLGRALGMQITQGQTSNPDVREYITAQVTVYEATNCENWLRDDMITREELSECLKTILTLADITSADFEEVMGADDPTHSTTPVDGSDRT